MGRLGGGREVKGKWAITANPESPLSAFRAINSAQSNFIFVIFGLTPLKIIPTHTLDFAIINE